jgi:hypothetical protein
VCQAGGLETASERGILRDRTSLTCGEPISKNEIGGIMLGTVIAVIVIVILIVVLMRVL